MRRDGLLKALARLSVETGSLACLGCGHEHNCAIHGCAILRAARETILHPVSREQVEKVFHGCEMCADWRKLKLKPCANGDLGVRADIGSLGEDDPFGLLVYDQYLPSGYVDFDFCPFCGAPKTGKAVDIPLKRLEALKDGKAD